MTLQITYVFPKDCEMKIVKKIGLENDILRTYLDELVKKDLKVKN